MNGECCDMLQMRSVTISTGVIGPIAFAVAFVSCSGLGDLERCEWSVNFPLASGAT